MKLSKKEIFGIFVLAVLATGSSLIIVGFNGCFGFRPEYDSASGAPRVLADCAVRGWPKAYFSEDGAVSLRDLVFDLIFYFTVFSVGWLILKLKFKKAKK